jgi:hypothetical protein
MKQRRSVGGVFTASGMADDPLLYTGGGMTEIILDLLFDVSLAGSSITTEDVREITAPLWELAENEESEDGYRRPPLVRLVWGKSWNIPGIVASVAERLEHFSSGGAPGRSWMRMRFLRVKEYSSQTRPHARYNSSPSSAGKPGIPEDQFRLHRIAGEGLQEKEGILTSGERLDVIAHERYGSASFWRVLASYNNISDPMNMVRGRAIKFVPMTDLEGV